MKSDYHFTVMKKEAVENLNLKSNGTYLDATLGMGGHTIEITNTRNDINKIICTNYAKSLLENDFVDNLAEAGLRVVDGFNTKEVDINSKKSIKVGFFEKLFHIFS